MKKKIIHFALYSALTLAVGFPAMAGQEGMASMPVITPTRVFTVQEGQDLESQRGFGDQEPTVRMMNLMMVEGSGMEGMDMAMNETHSAAASANTPSQTEGNYDYEIKQPSKAKVGTNSVDVLITDKKSKKPAKGLHLKSEVYMTSMDMGTETPAVKEISGGLYRIKAPFSMKGPWAIKLIFQDGKEEKVLNFDVQK